MGLQRSLWTGTGNASVKDGPNIGPVVSTTTFGGCFEGIHKTFFTVHSFVVVFVWVWKGSGSRQTCSLMALCNAVICLGHPPAMVSLVRTEGTLVSGSNVFMNAPS